jgi:hypothetical protein
MYENRFDAHWRGLPALAAPTCPGLR